MILALLFIVLAPGTLPAGAQAPAPTVQASSAPLSLGAPPGAQMVTDIYTVEKLRDPFVKGYQSSGGGKIKTVEGDEFSIHGLSLRALLKDPSVDYALFTDGTGASFILRKGKLYNKKGKLQQGISGVMDIRRRMVTLMTPDRDVQIFRLGEAEEEGEEESNL